MAVAINPNENELMSSLTHKRSEFRNAFRLKPLSNTGEEIDLDSTSATTTSLTFKDTTNELLSSLKERRLKRKTLLMPIKPEEGNDQQLQTVTDEGGVNIDGMRKLKSLRSRMKQTRFDTVTSQDQQDGLPSPVSPHPPVRSSPLSNSQSSRRWRLLSVQLGEVRKKTDEQRGLDFFTGGLDDDSCSYWGKDHDEAPPLSQEEEQQQLSSATNDRQEETDNGTHDPSLEEEGDQSTLIQPQVDYDPELQFHTVQEYQLPSYTPYRERLARENDIYFIPETKAAPIEHKTPGNAPPVRLEESGVYVGERPRVSASNQAIMENRLLKRPDKGAEWFGVDGLLKVQPNPLSPLVTRPLILAYEENAQVSYEQLPRVTVHNQYIIRSSDDKKYLIEFEIDKIKFKHHPLFSVEHVLASDLISQYQQYKMVDRHKIVDHLREKYNAMEYTIHSLKQSLTASRDLNEDMKSQLMLYQNEIWSVRQQLKQIEAAEYKSVRNILETWKQIKAIRESQTYTCTNVQITVNRINMDLHKDELNWEKDILTELNEQRADFNATNRESVTAYENELTQWKDYEKQRRKALHKYERRASRVALEEGTTDDDSRLPPLTTDGEEILPPPPEKPRPVAPPIFNDEEKKQEIINKYRKLYRKPGEPVLIPKLTFNHPISQQCPREEQLRRTAVSACRYRLKILYNDKPICSTKDCQLNNDFSVTFNENLRVEVIEWPVAIAFQILDTSSLLSSLLCQVFVPVPDSACTVSSSLIQDYQFSLTQRVVYSNHNGVGSGQSYPLIPDQGVLVTGGELSARVCWGEDEEGRTMCPQSNHNRKSGPDVAGLHDARKIKKWIDEVGLDPNDPRNFELLDLAKSITTSMDTASYFRLQCMDEVERFVSDEEFTKNKRFILLQLREQGHPALKGKTIPLDNESITDSFWKTVQDYKPYSLSDLPVTIFGSFYDEQKRERERYLIEIREKLLSRTGKRSPHDKLTLEDIIHEEFIPNISSLTSSFTNFFSPHRPLKPERKPYHQPKRQNTHVDSCHFAIRIIRATNIPLRDTDLLGGTDVVQKNMVKPFVEVSFGSEKRRTSTSHGPHPHWNEEIIIPFHPQQEDFSPTALQKITNELRFDLYDETTVDLLQDERQRNTDFHQRIEKKWLGVLSIPFSTLHAQSRIEGTFQVDTPPILIGYNQSNSSAPSDDKSVCIQVFVTIEPALGVLPPLTEKFESAEDPHLLSKATAWLRTLREKYPSRNYQATVLDVSGKNVFVTRFILPQNPPVEVLTAEPSTLRGKALLQCMEKLAWFVSLIPFLPDALLFSGSCDVWATSAQFLHMLGGDEEEHAVLLCNYFLHIGQDAWVVLGRAIPEGSTAYVLTYNPLDISNGYVLWDAKTGRHYLNTQSYLPLISIGVALNRQNVWGNAQEWDNPGQMNFNFHDSRSWYPMFPLTMEPLPSLQVETLQYTEVDMEPIQLLQSRIEQIIYSHIDSLRVRHITRWNRYCSRKLYNALKQFEETPFVLAETRMAHQQEMLATYPGYKVHGFPLNLRCANTQELIDAIEHTGFHLCEHNKVEFGLGVYIHPYPNNILSMWVYLMSLIPNN